MNPNSVFDLYQTASSPVHTLDPRVKITSTIAFILSCVLLPDGYWILYAISWGILILISFISQIKLSFILKRSLIAIPFTLMAITVIFTIPGEPLSKINLFNLDLTITAEGLIRFASIMIRAWCSVQATILLTATTTFPDLAHGLRHLYIPPILIAILSFMYRYLFVLTSEAQRLLNARAARSAISPGSKQPSLMWKAKVTGNMVGQLFLRSYERSDRVYDAMVARGFKGEFLTYNPHTMKTRDWISLLFVALFLFGIQSIAILF